MKRFILLITLFAGLSSCTKNSIDPLGGTGAGYGSISVEVDGKANTLRDPSAINLFGTITVTGDFADGSSLLLSMNVASVKSGAVIPFKALTDLDDDDNILGSLTAYTAHESGKEVTYFPASGQITISKYSGNRLEGTFSFKGQDPYSTKTHNLTNGKFSVPVYL